MSDGSKGLNEVKKLKCDPEKKDALLVIRKADQEMGIQSVSDGVTHTPQVLSCLGSFFRRNSNNSCMPTS